MGIKMKYFIDAEFIEDGKTIDLISIALVREEGSTLYLQNSECNFTQGSDFVWRHVYPHLSHFDMRGKRACFPQLVVGDSGLSRRTITPCRLDSDGDDPCHWATRAEIRDAVLAFCDLNKYGKPEFWGYYADYDWVAFCQLFGSMVELPKGFPMYCRDIKQWADDLGGIRIPKPEREIHHSLVDALWVKEAHLFLSECMKSEPSQRKSVMQSPSLHHKQEEPPPHARRTTPHESTL